MWSKEKKIISFCGESGKIYLYDNINFDIMDENKSINYLCELKEGFLVTYTSDYII